MRFSLLAALFLALIATPVLAEAQAKPEGDDFLEIPGMGRVPMPPGVHVFQPHRRRPGDDEERGALAQPKLAPKPPAPLEKSATEALNDLFARLKNESDEAEARFLAAKILTLLADTQSDTIKLLAARAEAAQAGGASAIALALLDDVIVLDPHWVEALVRRAKIKTATGDDAGARHDFEAAIRMEPRRFDALALLGALCEQTGDKKAALDAYRRALSFTPAEGALKKSEERLRFEVEGRDI